MPFISSGEASSAASNYNQVVSSFAELLQALLKLGEEQKEKQLPEQSPEQDEFIDDNLLAQYQQELDDKALSDFDRRLEDAKKRESGQPESQALATVSRSQVVPQNQSRDYRFEQENGALNITRPAGEPVATFHPRSGVQMHEGVSQREQASLTGAIAAREVANKILSHVEKGYPEKSGTATAVSGKDYSFKRTEDGAIEIKRTNGQPLVTFSDQRATVHQAFGKQDQERFVEMFGKLQQAEKEKQQSAQNNGASQSQPKAISASKAPAMSLDKRGR